GLVAGNQGPKTLLRLNADGTLDTTFNFTQSSGGRLVMDTLGRLYVIGSFTTSQGVRPVVRLNDDGSIDNSFNLIPAPAGSVVIGIAAQGNKLIVITELSGN